MPLIPAKFSSRGPRVAEQHKVHDIDPYTDGPWKILWRAKEKRRKHPERFQTLGEARAELIRRLDERLEGQQALERWEKEQEAEKAGSGNEPTAV